MGKQKIGLIGAIFCLPFVLEDTRNLREGGRAVARQLKRTIEWTRGHVLLHHHVYTAFLVIERKTESRER